MTSASELFCRRRYRFGRSDDVVLGLDSDPIPHYSQHHRCRRRQHDLDGCDPLRRSYHRLIHPIHRRSAQDRQLAPVDQYYGHSTSQDNICLESISSQRNRLLFNGNKQLPGDVILARERLLHRLRGVSVSRNRQNCPSNIRHDNDFAFSSDIVDSDIHREQHFILHVQEQVRRPGLPKGTLDHLQIEVFSKSRAGDEDCCICLESFMEGEGLMSLPCRHRFHSTCLDPWIQTREECPYCRAGIAVTGCTADKDL